MANKFKKLKSGGKSEKSGGEEYYLSDALDNLNGNSTEITDAETNTMPQVKLSTILRANRVLCFLFIS